MSAPNIPYPFLIFSHISHIPKTGAEPEKGKASNRYISLRARQNTAQIEKIVSDTTHQNV